VANNLWDREGRDIGRNRALQKNEERKKKRKVKNTEVSHKMTDYSRLGTDQLNGGKIGRAGQ